MLKAEMAKKKLRKHEKKRQRRDANVVGQPACVSPRLREKKLKAEARAAKKK